MANFEGFYEVSNHGRVRSIKRSVPHSLYNSTHTRVGCVASPRVVGAGYIQVVLQKNSRRYTRYVSRLVAEAFVPNPENKPEVNHLDCKKWHNWPSNLEWATRKENMRHAGANGLIPGRLKPGSSRPDRKTQRAGVLEILRRPGKSNGHADHKYDPECPVC